MPGVLLLLPLAYLLGSFPTAALVARATGHNVLTEGSRNPGASNVYRLAGWKAGLVVFVADFAKGAIPSAVGLVLDGHRGAYLLGAAAVIGHVFPITFRFRGGRGVAARRGRDPSGPLRCLRARAGPPRLAARRGDGPDLDR